MRLILSRKGFDSGAGGCPSPIFPDGSMISLPIPDGTSPVRYRDLSWRGRNLGDVVEVLTRGRVRGAHRAHVDPDLRRGLLSRNRGWRPSLGQIGSAQGHLPRQAAGVGDLFLFWGLFRHVDEDLPWVGPRKHMVWGWLQVGAVASVDAVIRQDPQTWAWLGRPHLEFTRDPSNTTYVAAEQLSLPGGADVPAAGVFDYVADARCLTAVGTRSPSTWSLPLDFSPRGRPALSFHRDESRWATAGNHAQLRCVGCGQEFVLVLVGYPGVRLAHECPRRCRWASSSRGYCTAVPDSPAEGRLSAA